jgi:hypothetical protein
MKGFFASALCSSYATKPETLIELITGRMTIRSRFTFTSLFPDNLSHMITFLSLLHRDLKRLSSDVFSELEREEDAEMVTVQTSSTN